MAEDSQFRDGDPLARGSKAKIRNIMSALYSHAIRWEWATRNPITSVRQSAKRQSVPEILTIDELVKLLNAIPALPRKVRSRIGLSLSIAFTSSEQRTKLAYGSVSAGTPSVIRLGRCNSRKLSGMDSTLPHLKDSRERLLDL